MTKNITNIDQLPTRLVGARGALPRTTVLPTGIDHVDELGEHLTALHDELTDLNRRFTEQRSQKATQRAEAADAAAFADARLEGCKDPGSKHVDKLRADLAEMSRLSRGLHETIERTDRSYRAAVSEEKDRLAGETVAALDETRNAVAGKVDELLELVAETNRLHRVARWLQGGPSTAGRPKPITAKVGGTSLPIDDLVGEAVAALVKRSALEPERVGYFIEDTSDIVPEGAAPLDPDKAERRRAAPGASIRNSVA